MSICRPATPWAATLVLAATVCAVELGAQSPSGLGRPVTPDEIAAWGPIVGPDGDGLPPGNATPAQGRRVYLQRCARCHGAAGNDGPDDHLVGGIGSLASDQPRKTVGSYWPAATTLWDYINRAMPFDRAGSLTPDEVYATAAYVLFLNGIVGEDDVIDATTLPTIEMPNRHGFVPDARPDVK